MRPLRDLKLDGPAIDQKLSYWEAFHYRTMASELYIMETYRLSIDSIYQNLISA
jgi:hypothetical protein